MSVKSKIVHRVRPTSKTYVKTMSVRNADKCRKLKKTCKQTPPLLLKRRSGKSGTRPKEILNRLHLRLKVLEAALEVSQTALKQRLTLTVTKRTRAAEPVTLDKTMDALKELPRDDIDILIYRLNALRSVL